MRGVGAVRYGNWRGELAPAASNALLTHLLRTRVLRLATREGDAYRTKVLMTSANASCVLAFKRRVLVAFPGNLPW